ncbi:hypothetical protein GCM10011591_12690 [Nocardia camponoti]|uniref:Uncharacterized protein n=1 Tax=Nocardia camponoti TaxID=1616106 RepID=A0A917QBS7_9NOCA|nr:hypothetical protein GCM10011591_12690 [Nocardia camponoti]
MLLTTAGMIIGGAVAIDSLEGQGLEPSPRPADYSIVVHRPATEHPQDTSLAVVRGLLTTDDTVARPASLSTGR